MKKYQTEFKLEIVKWGSSWLISLEQLILMSELTGIGHPGEATAFSGVAVLGGKLRSRGDNTE